MLVNVWHSIGLMDGCRQPRRKRCSGFMIDSREYSCISKDEADIKVGLDEKEGSRKDPLEGKVRFSDSM